MPRGPGKKDNYNLDYSRWNSDKFDDDRDEGTAASPQQTDIRNALRSMPPELQEAFRLQQIANESGDEKAKQRAGELAIRAVQAGSPEIQRDFLRNISQHDPEVAKQLGKELGLGAGKTLTAAETTEEAKQSLDGLDDNIKTLRCKMEKGADDTKKQLETLQRQQDQLERLKTPEDMLKFMHEEGDMSTEDLQRIFAGDQAFMEHKVKEVLDRATKSADRKSDDASSGGDFAQESEEALRQAELLHKSLVKDEEVTEGDVRALKNTKVVSRSKESNGQALDEHDEKEAPLRQTKVIKETKPDVVIPMYRLRYTKDDATGRFTAVELRCTLPGVLSMSAIALDISDKHMRLSTSSPEPRYAVNAGPFPVLIDPNGARAKFSRKREELTVEVPAA